MKSFIFTLLLLFGVWIFLIYFLITSPWDNQSEYALIEFATKLEEHQWNFEHHRKTPN